jgi:hypothetical protein
MKGSGVRPVRVLLSPELDDRVDEAVTSGVGGFRDKHALIAAAIDSYLIDLFHANAIEATPERPMPLGPTGGRPRTGLPRVAAAPRGTAVVDDAAILVDEPLLGLHNRDWPSLWALGVLAGMTVAGPVPWRVFLVDVTNQAWHIADEIATALPSTARKATALLPTNRDKAQSAEAAFQSFAVADVARRTNNAGKFQVGGPLPLWRTIGFNRTDLELMVGVTESGWELLDRMQDLDPSTPHAPRVASSFLDYLADHARTDWWGFDVMLQLLRESPTRDEYLAGFREARDWKSSVADSAAQGYLARGREWGLVEPKMSGGRYLLTAFGREMGNA